MKTMRDLINTVEQLNEGWWPGLAKPAATSQPAAPISKQVVPEPYRSRGYTAKQAKNGNWLYVKGDDVVFAGTDALPQTKIAAQPTPHVSQVVSQLQKLAYKLKTNPDSSDAREQVSHYVWGLKKTAAKYGAEQWLPHLDAIAKNTGDVAAINRFVSDYNAGHK